MKPSVLRTYLVSAFFLSLFVMTFLRFNKIIGETPRPLRFMRTAVPLLLICLGVNGVIIYVFSRRERRLAVEVLTSMKKGNLKARFPIRTLDEVGQVYQHFNSMADEMERLVGRLREAETARTQMLRELSHDVRTPLTSMRFIVETFHDRSEEVPPSELKEGSQTILEELSYFQRLIEDLFLLAQLDEPSYRATSSEVSLRTIFEEEAAKLAQDKISISVRATSPAQLFGDGQMLRRLARNLIDNAAHYARSKVEVVLTRHDALIEVRVVDDGPGLTAEAIESYGSGAPPGSSTPTRRSAYRSDSAPSSYEMSPKPIEENFPLETPQGEERR